MQRKAYQIAKPGNIETLKLIEEEIGQPKGYEVQIEVKAIGLNFADIFAMQGLYNAAPKTAFIPGLEFSGLITAIGSNVSKWKVGDRVMGATKFGGYVSHLNHHEDYMTAIPDNWSYEEGAGFVVQGLTAYYALYELGALKNGYTVLIQAGAGGVGILANRICKKANCFTIGTVSTAKKASFLKDDEAYDEVIVRGKDFAQQLKKCVGDRELNLVLESIGGDIFMDSYKAMAKMGRLITFGSASFTPSSSKVNYFKLIPKYLKRPKLDVMKMPTSNKSVMGFNLIWLYDRVELLHQTLEQLMALDLKPQHIGQCYNFDEMHQAIAHFKSGKTVGKVVVKV